MSQAAFEGARQAQKTSLLEQPNSADTDTVPRGLRHGDQGGVAGMESCAQAMTLPPLPSMALRGIRWSTVSMTTLVALVGAPQGPQTLRALATTATRVHRQQQGKQQGIHEGGGNDQSTTP